MRADVVIVGAGAAGGVAARRLAERGLDVVCLEQGEWTDREDYPGNTPAWELASRRQWSGSPNVRSNPADYPVDVSASDVGIQNFNGVGGGTILYAGQWPRMLPADFATRSLEGVGVDWPIGYRDLQPFYEEAERQFGVSGLAGNPLYPAGADFPLPPMPVGVAGMRVARAHARLGWHWWPEPNAILSAPYDGRHQCVQRGTCMQGCNEGAKGSTDLTHWPRAIAAGARLVTAARVVRIDAAGDRVTGATWLDADGRERHVAADAVVLAANGIGTARLLLASAGPRFPDGLANRSGLVGRNLMVHPYSLVVGLFDEPMGTWQGHFGASVQSLQFYRSDHSRGFARGAKWGLVPTGGPLRAAMGLDDNGVWGPDHHPFVRDRLGRSVAWGVLCEDLPDPDNRVTLSATTSDSSGLAAPVVTYRISDNSRAMMAWHVERATESLREAGAVAVEVRPFLPTGHALGTARMGDDPASSVVDRWGASHDLPNLWIIDGSVLPTVGGVNPTSTITALALRACDRLAEVGPRPRQRRASSVAVPERAARARPGRARPEPPPFSDAERRTLANLADRLIPPDRTMPAPSTVGIHEALLDRVLSIRPDLREPLRRALATDTSDAATTMRHLAATDPPARQALALVVAGGYYLDAEVRRLVGYPGQEPRPVVASRFPDYIEEGLLDHVLGGGSAR